MKYLSLFTGAGGMDIGLERAGLSPAAFSEIDKYASAVLETHWPEVPNLGDVHHVAHENEHAGLGQVGADESEWVTHGSSGNPRHSWEGVDLVVGGFPCQDISVAGRRAGLDGARSGLWWEFHRVIEAVRPNAVLLENVVGLLSSKRGRDMAAIIDALVELGYGVAWRVLDSQHFGVPQRRRRVFLLGVAGGRTGARRSSEVLHLADCSERHHQEGVWAPAVNSPRPPGSTGGVVVSALKARNGEPDDNDAQAGHLVPSGRSVRRLTPRECERLQGWPDDWTRFRPNGDEISDTQRYKMIGNGVTAPVAEWVGRRMLQAL